MLNQQQLHSTRSDFTLRGTRGLARALPQVDGRYPHWVQPWDDGSGGGSGGANANTSGAEGAGAAEQSEQCSEQPSQQPPPQPQPWQPQRRERFSLIFYCTEGERTPPGRAVFPSEGD